MRKHKQIKPPPKRLFFIVNWFRLGLVLSVVIFSLLGLVACSNTSTAPEASWHRARETEVVSLTQLQQLVEDYTSELIVPPSIVAEEIAVFSVDLEQGKQLNIFDFQLSDLCGQLGCFFVGYLGTGGNKLGREVLAGYIPQSPGLTWQIGKTNRTRGELPCIHLQSGDEGGIQEKLCFDGKFYSSSNSSSSSSSSSSNSSSNTSTSTRLASLVGTTSPLEAARAGS